MRGIDLLTDSSEDKKFVGEKRGVVKVTTVIAGVLEPAHGKVSPVDPEIKSVVIVGHPLKSARTLIL